MCASDLNPTGGTYTWNGHTIVCDHAPRVNNIPHPCTYCAVAGVLTDSDDEAQPLFANAVTPTQLEAAARPGRQSSAIFGGPAVYKLPGLNPANKSLQPDGLSDADTQRLRVAIATRATNTTQYLLLRARAWVTLSWPRGLRMGSDLTHNVRTDVTFTDTHITVLLRKTKDDAAGNKQDICYYPWIATGGETSPAAQAIATYLAVRDLTHRPTDPLIVSTRDRPTIRPKKRNLSATAAGDIRRLAETAGLEPKWTAHSTRAGYATQADTDGWAVEEIQAGLRHESPDTTMPYIRRNGHTVRRSVKRLADAS
jgi:integrase